MMIEEWWVVNKPFVFMFLCLCLSLCLFLSFFVFVFVFASNEDGGGSAKAKEVRGRSQHEHVFVFVFSVLVFVSVFASKDDATVVGMQTAKEVRGRSQREHSDSEWKPSQRDICSKCGSSNSCEKLATVLSVDEFLVGLPRYTEARMAKSSKLVRYSRIHTLDFYWIHRLKAPLNVRN